MHWVLELCCLAEKSGGTNLASSHRCTTYDADRPQGDSRPSTPSRTDPDWNAGRGTRAAVVGAVMGLVPAMVLGSLRFLLADGPERIEGIVGNIVFGLVYASPYLLTLIVSREKSPAVRGGLLVALGLLSFVASFSSLSLVTIVLLPATFVIWFAAVRSLTVSVRPLATTALATLAGLVFAATVGFGFFVLFGIEEDQARCWVLFQGPDGRYEWESRPNVGGPVGLSPGPLSGGPAMVTYDEGVTWQRVGPSVSSRGYCTSDIITNIEAAMSMGVLAAAFLAMVLILRIGRTRTVRILLD